MVDNQIKDLSRNEICLVGGGLGPVGAYAIAIGLGSLFIASFQAGYQFGSNLAAGQNLRQPDVKQK